jgi:Tfp pilus assembly protein PilO
VNLLFWTRLSKREKPLFYLTMAIALVTLADRAVVGPILSRLHTLDERIASQEELIKRNLRIVSEKDRVKAAAKEFDVYSRKSSTNEEEVAGLLGEIETLARKNALYVLDMKPLVAQEDATSRKYAFDLNCEAQMDQLVHFMHDVENSQRLFIIESFNIMTKAKDSSIAKCNLRISNIVFL